MLRSWGPEELQELLTHAPQGPELTVRVYRYHDGPDRGSCAQQDEFERIRAGRVWRGPPHPFCSDMGALLHGAGSTSGACEVGTWQILQVSGVMAGRCRSGHHQTGVTEQK